MPLDACLSSLSLTPVSDDGCNFDICGHSTKKWAFVQLTLTVTLTLKGQGRGHYVIFKTALHTEIIDHETFIMDANIS